MSNIRHYSDPKDVRVHLLGASYTFDLTINESWLSKGKKNGLFSDLRMLVNCELKMVIINMADS